MSNQASPALPELPLRIAEAAPIMGMTRQGLDKAIREGRIRRAVIPWPEGPGSDGRWRLTSRIACPALAARELAATTDPMKRPMALLEALALPPAAPLDLVWAEDNALWAAVVECLVAMAGGRKVRGPIGDVLLRLEENRGAIGATARAAGLLTTPEGDEDAPSPPASAKRRGRVEAHG